ncbi:MAG: hypothetical protein ONB47_21215, partial [candidate division KSB1 bacterium]|nr:hypothetical protein [candidate division KSB1 bacterium]
MSTNSSLLTEFWEHAISPGQQQARMPDSGSKEILSACRLDACATVFSWSEVTCLVLLKKTAPDHEKFYRSLLTEFKGKPDAHVYKQFTPDGVLGTRHFSRATA